MSKKKIFPSLKPSVLNPYRFFIIILLLSAAALPVNFIYFYNNRYGVYGLPFDDAFIHLTFAKNLSEYLSFSFFKDEMITSGSTSPLFTFILAAGNFFIENEFLLSYAAGISMFILSIIILFKINLLDFKTKYPYLIASVLIFALDKKIIFFSVSGMETGLFVFNLLLSLYFYRILKIVPLAVTLALSVWIRPEGILFIFAIIIDYFYNLYFIRDNSRTCSIKLTSKNIRLIFFIISGSFLLYAFFNLFLSGTVLPNTFYAKRIFYSPEFMSRETFLENDVLGFFASGSYSFFMPGFIFSFVKLLCDLFKRKGNINFLFFIFIIIFILAFWLSMPYSGLNGRYFVPLIPFYLMVSVSGFIFLFDSLSKYAGSYIHYAKYIVWLICIYMVSHDLYSEREVFSNECRKNQIIHIDAADWIKKNTAPKDVIATHEIGAIGFYSNRKIIDIVGLVTPQLIEKLPDENYISVMQDFLREKDVKYFATMKNWCRVDNANPLFTSEKNERSTDAFEIFKYVPGETHILSKKTNRLLALVQYNLSKNYPDQALFFLTEAVKSDPESALSHFHLADVLIRFGDTVNSEINLLKAIKLFPDYPDANFQLGKLYKSRNDSVSSKECFNRYKKSKDRIFSSYKTISGKLYRESY